jgi:hypothetical protein
MSGIDPEIIAALGGAGGVVSGITVATAIIKERLKRKRSQVDDETEDQEITLTITDKDGSVTYEVTSEADDDLVRKLIEEIIALKEAEEARIANSNEKDAQPEEQDGSGGDTNQE